MKISPRTFLGLQVCSSEQQKYFKIMKKGGKQNEVLCNFGL